MDHLGFLEPPTPNWEAQTEVESEARPIIKALSILLSQARLAANNPDGMAHLLFLYGLDRHFQPELKAMKKAHSTQKQR